MAKTPKFLNMNDYVRFKTKVSREDWRPIISEQTASRNIIFVMNDTELYADIKHDAKWIFFDWQDDLKGFLTESEIYEKMDSFRNKNLKKLEGVKRELQKEKVIW